MKVKALAIPWKIWPSVFCQIQAMPSATPHEISQKRRAALNAPSGRTGASAIYVTPTEESVAHSFSTAA